MGLLIRGSPLLCFADDDDDGGSIMWGIPAAAVDTAALSLMGLIDAIPGIHFGTDGSTLLCSSIGECTAPSTAVLLLPVETVVVVGRCSIVEIPGSVGLSAAGRLEPTRTGGEFVARDETDDGGDGVDDDDATDATDAAGEP